MSKIELLNGFAEQTAAELARLRTEEAFGEVMLATAALSGDALFREFARHIAEACQASCALLGGA